MTDQPATNYDEHIAKVRQIERQAMRAYIEDAKRGSGPRLMELAAAWRAASASLSAAIAQKEDVAMRNDLPFPATSGITSPALDAIRAKWKRQIERNQRDRLVKVQDRRAYLRHPVAQAEAARGELVRVRDSRMLTYVTPERRAA